jgi:ribosomal protein L32
MVPHHVCPTCGYYSGRQVVEVKAKEEEPQA